MSKSVNELGRILKDMYDHAPRKEQVTMIYVFGIQYHEDIQAVGIKAVIDAADIHSTYRTELNKAVRLAKYVRPL